MTRAAPIAVDWDREVLKGVGGWAEMKLRLGLLGYYHGCGKEGKGCEQDEDKDELGDGCGGHGCGRQFGWRGVVWVGWGIVELI